MWDTGPLVALPILESAIHDIGGHLPQLAISMLTVATVFAELIPDGPRMTQYAQEAERLAEGTQGFETLAAQFAVAIAATATGDSERAELAYAQIDPVMAMLADNVTPEFEHILGAYGALGTQRERWDDARSLLEKLLSRAEQKGASAQTSLFSGTLAQVEWFRGDWLRTLSLAKHNARVMPGQVSKALGLAFLGTIEASMGFASQARETLSTVATLVGAGGATAVVSVAEAAEGLLLLSEGKDAEAVTHLSLACGIHDRGGLNECQGMWWRADLIEALWAVERIDEARAELDALRFAAERSKRLSTWAFVARLEALLRTPVEEQLGMAATRLGPSESEGATVQTGSFREVSQAFAHAEALALEAGLPFAQARTVFALARWKVRHEDPSAVTSASRARSLFDKLGASLFSDRAAAICGDDGIQPKVHVSQRLVALSPAELRVVAVIVRGRTIKAAADELILSAKTVDAHLQQIYRKLEIRSRAELAFLFAREHADL
jgi:DNA-binding CsgD family transcriptional regulator